jgi:hypothetical protein
MNEWDPGYDRECHELVAAICGPDREASRTRSWQVLITKVGPFIEDCASTSPLLRRCRLQGEDETRAILVAVLERLRQNDFQNLRSYLARQTTADRGDCETAAVDELARVARLCDEEDGQAASREVRPTPFRGWLLQLTQFVVRDHVRRRLGWGKTAVAELGVEPRGAKRDGEALAGALRQIDGIVLAQFDARTSSITVEYLSGSVRIHAITRAIEDAGWSVVREPEAPASKRDVGTDARRLHDVSEQGERPPITDLVAVRRLIAEVQAYMSTFPAPMQEALALWLEDHGFAEISARLSLGDPAQARAMVRAGQARLRERFRGDWPALFGAAA